MVTLLYNLILLLCMIGKVCHYIFTILVNNRLSHTEVSGVIFVSLIVFRILY